MANGTLKTTLGLARMLSSHFKDDTSPPTKIRVGEGTTTPNIADETLTTFLTGGEFSLVSGFPEVDETELNAETRVEITLTDLNGESITEAGEFDTNDVMHSHAVFDAESKSNTDIFFIVEKTKLRIQT